MTISARGVRVVYNGSGSTGPFALTDANAQAILFENNSEIVVVKYNSSGVGTTLVLNTDYTLTGAGESSAGAVTLISALAVGEKLAIRRSTTNEQLVDPLVGGRLNVDNIEDALDKLTRIAQEHTEKLDVRALLFPANYTGSGLTLPIPEASAYLGWNSDADELENKDAPTSFRNGSGAPASVLGDNGDFYLDTSAMTLYGPKTAGAWGSGTSLVGPQGPEGDQGEQGDPGNGILSGSGAPGGGLGMNGDFYIDTATYEIYGPKTAGAWGSATSLVGPPGAGSGDVVGPGTATANAIALFDGTTGKLIKDGGVTIASGAVSGISSIEMGHASDTTVARASAGDLSVEGNIVYRAGGTDVAIADGGTGAGTAAAAFSNLKQAATDSATGVIEHATVAEVRAATTGNLAVTPALIESAAAGVALSDAATVAVDWDTGINFTLTVTANRAIGNPTNGQPGTFRTILVQGNDTTDRTITFGNQFLGEVPTITDCDSGRWYLLTIYCVSATHFVVSSKRANG